MDKKISAFYFIISQLASLVGSKVSHAAIGFWLYEKTHSVTSFSIILFLSFLPNIIGSFFAGPLVDRFSFRWTFGFGDIISAVLTLLTALTMNFINETSIGLITLIYLMIFVISMISALQWVALNSYLPMVFSGDDLVKTNGMLSTATSMASLFAPSLAGLGLKFIGIGNIFLIDGISYLLSAVIIYTLLPEENKIAPPATQSFFDNLREGFDYLRQQDRIFSIIGLFVIFNFFAGINTNLMTPLYIERFSPLLAGYVLSMMGLGSVLVGLLQSAKPQWIRYITSIRNIMLVIFALDIGLAIWDSIVWAGLVMLSLGGLITATNSRTSLLIQEEVSSQYRGRVFAAARGLSWICLPLAHLLCGLFSDGIHDLYFSKLSKVDYLGHLFLGINIFAIVVLIFYSHKRKALSL